MPGHTLYIDNAQKRFFHVPNDLKCPPGDYRVQSLLGKELATHPVVLDVYEVSEEEAKKITEESVYAFGRTLRGLLGKVPNTPPDPTMKGRSDRLAEALGGLMDTLREASENPEAAAEKMRRLSEPLAQHGLSEEGAATLQQIPQRLREVLEDPARKAEIEAATESLRKATDELVAAVNRQD